MPLRYRISVAAIPLWLALGAKPAAAETKPTHVTFPAVCESVSPADFERAHTLFLSGKQFLEEANYDKAISYFLDAYSINCNLHELLVSIATVLERKGDKAEAIRTLNEYLVRSPGTQDREKIERRIHNLEEQLSAMAKNGASDATSPPAETQSAHPESLAKEHPVVIVEPKSAPATEAPHGSSSIAPWIVVAGGATLAATGAVLFATGYQKYNAKLTACDKSSNCDAATDPSATADYQAGNSAIKQWYIGAVMTGVGAAGVAAGLAWWGLTPSHGARQDAGLSVVPIVLPTMKGMGASFRF